MMSSQIQLRPAVARDLIAILDLERASETAPHWPRATYAAILDAGAQESTAIRRCMIVAHDAELPAGFAVALIHTADRTAELESVVVAASVRRAGIGRSLCAAIFEWCRSQGATEVILEVRAASTGAIAFYTGLGFTQTGRRPHYYHDPDDDAVVMRLVLQESPTSPPAPAGAAA